MSEHKSQATERTAVEKDAQLQHLTALLERVARFEFRGGERWIERSGKVWEVRAYNLFRCNSKLVYSGPSLISALEKLLEEVKE